MENFRKLGISQPACGYTNCSRYNDEVIHLSFSKIPVLFDSLYGMNHITEEKIAKTDDGFCVTLTDESARMYYLHRVLNFVPEDERQKLKIEAQTWINSVQRTSAIDFTGHIRGIQELPELTGKQVNNPNFWHRNTVREYVPYIYSIPTLREAAGLCLLYNRVSIGKQFIHGHGN